MPYRIKLPNIFCIILLLTAYSYSGRALYGILLIFSVYAFLKSLKIKSDDLAVSCMLLAFILLATLLSVLSGKNVMGITYTIMIFIPAYMFILKKSLYSSKKLVIALFTLFIIFSDVVTIFQFLVQGYSRQGIKVIGASVNYLAALNNLYFIMAYDFLLEQTKQNLLLRIGVSISTLFILLSLSRVSLAMLILNICAILLIKLFNSHQKEKLLLLLKTLVVLIVSVLIITIIYKYSYKNSAGFYSSINSFKHYFKNIKTLGVGGSRAILWKTTREELKNNIFIGANTFLVNDNGNLSPPHNFIMEILLLNGLFGMAAYIISVMYIFKKLCLKNINKKVLLIIICFNYWGICLLHPFLTTSYLYNIMMGYGLLCINDTAKK